MAHLVLLHVTMIPGSDAEIYIGERVTIHLFPDGEITMWTLYNGCLYTKCDDAVECLKLAANYSNCFHDEECQTNFYTKGINCDERDENGLMCGLVVNGTLGEMFMMLKSLIQQASQQASQNTDDKALRRRQKQDSVKGLVEYMTRQNGFVDDRAKNWRGR